MNPSTVTVRCAECGKPFAFSRKTYSELGLSQPPSRCLQCRDMRIRGKKTITVSKDCIALFPSVRMGIPRSLFSTQWGRTGPSARAIFKGNPGAGGSYKGQLRIYSVFERPEQIPDRVQVRVMRLEQKPKAGGRASVYTYLVLEHEGRAPPHQRPLVLQHRAEPGDVRLLVGAARFCCWLENWDRAAGEVLCTGVVEVTEEVAGS